VTVSPPAGRGSAGGAEVFLYVHHHLREDAQTLYGFRERDERVAFEALLGAHGVGPALALAILSVHAPGALRQILLDDDVDALCLVPGVGKKTAARLLIELKSRLDIPDLARSAAMPGGRRRTRADVRALASLEYQPDEVLTVAGCPAGARRTLLKEALKRLAVGSPG
jgi:Holliday junction DNA helicase RuvA